MIGGPRVRVGLHSGQQYRTFGAIREVWQRAEELGFDWVSLFDHFRPPLGGQEGPCFEGPTVLAALAASTKHVRCGMLLSAVTWRHPAIAASIAATLDHVSGGRLEFGVGAGGADLGYAQYGIDFPDAARRVEMLDEACHIMRSLWSQGRVNFSGRYYRLADASLEPKPLQDHLPLIIGGGGRRTLRVVARHADIWNVLADDPRRYQERRETLARFCEETGRGQDDPRKSITFRVVLGHDDESARRRMNAILQRLPADSPDLAEYLTIGTPQQCVADLLQYARLGVRDFLLACRPPLDWETIEIFASRVTPTLREMV